ncbi:hypothetical protein [Geomonas subterranea]|uniref:hypothetical protein n=1 Tax=Geomonas subterranea TaxID=2847989 RepID=UPI001CD4A31A|nr:hypothetical protein [Geomonas fuzhouensis]
MRSNVTCPFILPYHSNASITYEATATDNDSASKTKAEKTLMQARNNLALEEETESLNCAWDRGLRSASCPAKTIGNFEQQQVPGLLLMAVSGRVKAMGRFHVLSQSCVA